MKERKTERKKEKKNGPWKNKQWKYEGVILFCKQEESDFIQNCG